jgi:hypothetical protein
LEFLSEYDFEINRIKGKDNQVVDALNKRAHEMHAKTIITYRSDLKEKYLEATNSYQHYLKIKETLQPYNFQHKFKYYELKDDRILMYRGKVYVPNSRELENIVLRKMHNVSFVGN